VQLEADPPAVDDVIHVEAPIHRTATVAFPLNNNLPTPAPFEAFFTPDSAAEMSVFPTQGVLAPAGAEGTTFMVSFSPKEYGKPVVGTLVVRTKDMQWSYEVRGSPPKYTAPSARPRVTTQLAPDLRRTYEQRRRGHGMRNIMRENISRTRTRGMGGTGTRTGTTTMK